MFNLGVIATHDARHAANATRLDGVVKRSETWTELPAKHVVNDLGRETGNQRFFLAGDVDLVRIAIGVVVDCKSHDLLGRLHGLGLVELQMRRTGELSLGACGNYLRVEATL